MSFVSSLDSKIEKKAKKITYLTLAGTQMGCGFKEYDLITCKWKVQDVVSVGS